MWTFLPILGLTGALWPAYWYAGSYLILWPGMRYFSFSRLGFSWDQFVLNAAAMAPMGAVAGVILALIATGRTRMKAASGQGPAPRLAQRLLQNLFWCNVYPFSILMVNGVLAGVLYKTRLVVPSYQGISYLLFCTGPILGLALFSLIAIVWATFRSIHQPDALSPRTLLARLHRSSRLEVS